MCSSTEPVPLTVERIAQILSMFSTRTQSRRVFSLFKMLKRILTGYGLSDRPNTVIASKQQGFFVVPETQKAAGCVSLFMRDATAGDAALLQELLQGKGMSLETVEVRNNHPHRIPKFHYHLNTRKGRIVVS